MLAQAVSQLVVVAVVAWFVGPALLRLVAISCAICATALLAIGDVDAATPAGVAAFGVACWLVGDCARRARRGYWRSPTLGRILMRPPR